MILRKFENSSCVHQNSQRPQVLALIVDVPVLGNRRAFSLGNFRTSQHDEFLTPTCRIPFGIHSMRTPQTKLCIRNRATLHLSGG